MEDGGSGGGNLVGVAWLDGRREDECVGAELHRPRPVLWIECDSCGAECIEEPLPGGIQKPPVASGHLVSLVLQELRLYNSPTVQGQVSSILAR